MLNRGGGTGDDRPRHDGCAPSQAPDPVLPGPYGLYTVCHPPAFSLEGEGTRSPPSSGSLRSEANSSNSSTAASPGRKGPLPTSKPLKPGTSFSYHHRRSLRAPIGVRCKGCEP